ncbi:delta-9 desaturase-like 1 protein [Brassica napus]|uniref:delta-9 desaturase-like 1 protein n=1 Tax=Brassica napus TaxID=3708 RepID=UPI002078F2D1|nr:delta-9 desaturase-like 1 protein [Brassica napus]
MDDTTKEDGSGSSRKPVRKEKRSYIFRKWTWIDVMKASSVGTVHLLCILAPFNFKWEALLFGVILAMMSALSITFSYHRNLAHRSFKLPKWLEYSFAYSALFALQGHPIDWAPDKSGPALHRFHHQFTDSDRDPHSPIEGFWFSHVFWIFDSSYIREKGVGGTITYHGTGIVNSACHIWGSRAWNTKDTSRNIWWLGPFTMGESWHNNHHAFETSARYGLEWYQVDLSWYLISFFQALGLATDVKLPSEAQKRKLAFAR